MELWLFRGAGRASGRRKAELANLFLGSLVSHAKDCLNSANPRCLWSNLVYSASASDGCSDRNLTQAICLPKLSSSGRLVFRPHLLVPAFWRHPAKRLEPFWGPPGSIYELHLFLHGECCWWIACEVAGGSGGIRNPCPSHGAEGC